MPHMAQGVLHLQQLGLTHVHQYFWDPSQLVLQSNTCISLAEGCLAHLRMSCIQNHIHG